MDDPIHFVFGSSVRFLGSANRMTLFAVLSNPRWQDGGFTACDGDVFSCTSISVKIYSDIARFLCDSTAFL